MESMPVDSMLFESMPSAWATAALMPSRTHRVRWSKSQRSEPPPVIGPLGNRATSRRTSWSGPTRACSTLPPEAPISTATTEALAADTPSSPRRCPRRPDRPIRSP